MPGGASAERQLGCQRLQCPVSSSTCSHKYKDQYKDKYKDKYKYNDNCKDKDKEWQLGCRRLQSPHLHQQTNKNTKTITMTGTDNYYYKVKDKERQLGKPSFKKRNYVNIIHKTLTPSPFYEVLYFFALFAM